MERVRFHFYVALTFAVAGFGCSSAPKPGEFSGQEMMAAACPSDFATSAAPKVVRGSVWTKITSKEMSGQFPASVLSEYPKKLAVEVTNLIGAPQAWLKIEDGKAELRFTAENEKEYGKSRTRSMLGGLPIELAPRLFAGGVPCPSEDKNQDLRQKATDEGGLEVISFDLRTHTQTRYVYTFIRYGGKPWVSEAEWEVHPQAGRAGSKKVKITREEPTEPDGAPRRWSASSERGDIQVRWKDRTVGSR